MAASRLPIVARGDAMSSDDLDLVQSWGRRLNDWELPWRKLPGMTSDSCSSLY
ncbi:hypothetical protein BDW72DRAFT_176182 [Aspergillus terricola var. indicus]